MWAENHISQINYFSKFSPNVSRAQRQTFMGQVWGSSLCAQPRWTKLLVPWGVLSATILQSSWSPNDLTRQSVRSSVLTDTTRQKTGLKWERGEAWIRAVPDGQGEVQQRFVWLMWLKWQTSEVSGLSWPLKQGHYLVNETRRNSLSPVPGHILGAYARADPVGFPCRNRICVKRHLQRLRRCVGNRCQLAWRDSHPFRLSLQKPPPGHRLLILSAPLSC